MSSSVLELVQIPSEIVNEYLEFEKPRQIQLSKTCAEIDRLYRLYKGILYQIDICNKSIEKVATYSIDDHCDFILKRKDLKIQIPVILSTLDILYQQKAIVLKNLEMELKELQIHKQFCMEHAEMNLNLANELTRAGISSRQKRIAADLLLQVVARIDCLNGQERLGSWDNFIKSTLEKHIDPSETTKRKREWESSQPDSPVKRVCVEVIPNSIPNELDDFEFKKPISQVTPTKLIVPKAMTPTSAWFSQTNPSSPFMSTGQESRIHEIYPEVHGREFPSSLEAIEPQEPSSLDDERQEEDSDEKRKEQDIGSLEKSGTTESSIESHSESQRNSNLSISDESVKVAQLGSLEVPSQPNDMELENEIPEQLENDLEMPKRNTDSPSSSSQSSSSSSSDSSDGELIEATTTYSVQLDAYIATQPSQFLHFVPDSQGDAVSLDISDIMEPSLGFSGETRRALLDSNSGHSHSEKSQKSTNTSSDSLGKENISL